MVVIERVSGQGIVIGPYTIRVLEVGPGEVVIALEGPDEDAAGGPQPGDGCLAAAGRSTVSPTPGTGLPRPGAPAWE
jgi:hypothetical protein